MMYPNGVTEFFVPATVVRLVKSGEKNPSVAGRRKCVQDVVDFMGVSPEQADRIITVMGYKAEMAMDT